MKRKKDDLDRLTEKLLKKDPSLKEDFEKDWSTPAPKQPKEKQ